MRTGENRRGPGGIRSGDTSPGGPGPGRVGWGPAFVYTRFVSRTLSRYRPRSNPVEYFFETLLVLVCVGVLAFTGLAVKKLYQGQR
ncbi:hypothetical protein OK074_3187 [Actinobacteria bacterium OK074]|nr:hypothetical protein OK074_3187 [Actinobacteria bacterium OK074]